MIKNILKKLGRILLANLSFIIAFILILFIITFEFPYIIESPGGIINLDRRITVENGYEISGSYNMTYVQVRKATIPTLLLSYFNKSWDVYKNSDYIENGTTSYENDLRGKIVLKESNDNAIINAYKMAGIDVSVKSEQVYVIYIDSNANTDLKVGDEIVSVDGVKVESAKHLSMLSSIYSEGDKVNIETISDGKKYNRYAYVYTINGKKVFGIYVALNKELEYSPKVKFNFLSSEFGSSAGLMETLYIYDCLVEKDISNGLKIAGTGTIDALGNITSIDGVKYKLKGAVKEKADIFFVPSGENYEEALECANENNYDIDIVPVSTFDEALFYLYNYNK